MEFQTRSEKSGVRFHDTFERALDFAQEDKEVWKISFTIPDTRERVRFVRTDSGWVLEDVFGKRGLEG
jgi:hypothetical protein